MRVLASQFYELGLEMGGREFIFPWPERGYEGNLGSGISLQGHWVFVCDFGVELVDSRGQGAELGLDRAIMGGESEV